MKHDSDTEGTAARSRVVVALRNLRGYKIAEGDPDVRGWEVAGGDGLRIGTVNDLLVDTAAGKARYLDIQLDPGLYLQGTPTGLAADSERRLDADPAPELDPMSGPESGVIGHATVPAAEIEPNPGATTMTEHLVRESISDTENRLTAHLHLDELHHPGERHVVFPVGQARLDPEHDKVILASLRAEDAVNLPAYVPGEVSPDYEQGLRRWFDPSFTPSEGQDLYAHDLYDEDSFYRNRREAPIRGR
ncbi:MAG TPA: PRC-barrel domain-containing protein [Thermoanaerobaculia bacterium]|nr:PRC-barrel domain-containing protein [Thermoanaerobaculia bacterium]